MLDPDNHVYLIGSLLALLGLLAVVLMCVVLGWAMITGPFY